MSSPKSLITRKAAKAVVTHTAHGTLSKARRRPLRTGTLLGAGGLLGAAIGYLVGRRATAAPPTTPTPAPHPASTATSTPPQDVVGTDSGTTDSPTPDPAGTTS